jgi:hypothetical protein
MMAIGGFTMASRGGRHEKERSIVPSCCVRQVARRSQCGLVNGRVRESGWCFGGGGDVALCSTKLPGPAKAWRLTDSTEASWKVACRSLHEAFRTNRLKHVVVAAYRRRSFVGETAGSHGSVAVGRLQSMSLILPCYTSMRACT